MLKGKTAVITGGSRGIGAAIAYRLASLGANVAVLYAGNADAAQQVCTRCIKDFGATARSYRCDVSDFEWVKKTVAQIKDDFGGVQIVINNAGVTRDGLVATMKEEDFDKVLDTNLKGAFNVMRHTIPLLLRAKDGCIINISSVSGLMGNAGQGNYAASKAGLVGLTKSVAKEYAAKGIRCNAVAPGFIKTDMTDTQADNPLLERIPLKKMGDPEDVAQAVVYLVNAKYVTGEVLRVDGGIAM